MKFTSKEIKKMYDTCLTARETLQKGEYSGGFFSSSSGNSTIHSLSCLADQLDALREEMIRAEAREEALSADTIAMLIAKINIGA